MGTVQRTVLQQVILTKELRLYMKKGVQIFFISLFLVGCYRMSEKKEVVHEKETVAPVKKVGDTLFAVIQNPKKKPVSLSKQELAKIDSILVLSVAAYNKQVKMDKLGEYWLIDLKEYKRQYFPSYNKKGQKIIWIGCFCQDFGLDWTKVEINSKVLGGGKCHFHLELNLNTSKYSELKTNFLC